MKNKHQTLSLSITLVALYMLMMPKLASAEIFKCVNTKGDTYYNDMPCPKSNEETKIEGVKDPKGGFIPSLNATNLEKSTKSPASMPNGRGASSKNSGSPQDKVESRQASTKSSDSSGKSASSESNTSDTQASAGLNNQIDGDSQSVMANNPNAESNMKLVNDVQQYEPDVPMK
ncbi:MAG: DUF4124 domain-containing protein [Cocleimonas sp.]|nr:DUF4124 domain-containing protein [Cocleimonas sp.]